MKLRPIVRGFAGFIPGFLEKFKKGTGGSISAKYCYSVWLRHLILLNENGLKKHPKTVAEIGPGDSLGVGIAALLTGADKFYAFDIIEHANNRRNLEIFHELLLMFKNREKIPAQEEFPYLKPELNSYEFPHNILSQEYLDKVLNKNRIYEIEKAILNINNTNNDKSNSVMYYVPWFDKSVVQIESVDLVYSQAVMEHILNLEISYLRMYEWLKKGGYISHQIDYKAHETHNVWNGHWAYSDFIWKLIMKGRSYPISRMPHSVHLQLIQKVGFHLISEKKKEDRTGYNRNKIHKKFQLLSDNDFITSSAYIIAQKV